MNLLTIEDVSKHYGIKPVLDHVAMGIDDKDKIGIIGINGTGKSTLLKIIAGIETPDSGQIVKGNQVMIEYLPQNPEFKESETVLEHVLSGKSQEDVWSVESEAKSILNELSMSDFDANVMELSGGQRKRVALAKALLTPAQILVLDEPTNHLDNEMAEWLESYLKKFKGAIVMVTHDRYFLDCVTNKIIEIDGGSLYSYVANYSKFVEMKAQRMDMALASERKRESILRNELAWMMRGARARSTKQKARIERFEEMNSIRKIRAEADVELNSVGSRLGRKTIELHQISKAYGEKVLVKDFEYIFLKNSRIGIVGENGAGKSTLMKMIMGLEQPDSGTIEIGETVRIGYFSQENEYLDESLRVIDYIKNVAEYIETADGKASASQMLERFLFTPDMQWAYISKLSGGEKRRLYLLRVLMEAPNVLILDEPTNDLDIRTLTILEDYLDHFAGIVITVSHDRYFLDRVVDRIFAFEGQGRVCQYEGGFSDYYAAWQQKQQETGIEVEAPKKEKAKQTQRVRTQKLKFTYKEQKEFETIDDDIAAMEEKVASLEDEIVKASTDFIKLNQLTKEKDEAQEQLDTLMERWVYLNDLAERIEAMR